MLPTGNPITTPEFHNKTYHVHFESGGISGYIDGKESLKQAIKLMLSTPLYFSPIYDDRYGLQTEDLIGKEPGYCMGILPGRIKTCLMQDNRVTDVINFAFKSQNECLLTTFEVISIYGIEKGEVVI